MVRNVPPYIESLTSKPLFAFEETVCPGGMSALQSAEYFDHYFDQVFYQSFDQYLDQYFDQYFDQYVDQYLQPATLDRMQTRKLQNVAFAGTNKRRPKT